MIKQFIDIGREQLIEDIKMFLYKENPNIFEIVDFEDDNIYQEPLLFAYYNSKEKSSIQLNTILYGYMNPRAQQNGIIVKSDKYGRIYIPNLGWFITDVKNQQLNLLKDELNQFSLLSNNANIQYRLESTYKIDNTDIEYLMYPVALLNQCFFNTSNELIPVEIESISKKHLHNIVKAFSLIKDNAPGHYDLICSVTKKIIVFNVDTNLRNSFATMNAQGISFLNAYQKSYDEVFFIDDIAHQTGHVIFNAIICDFPNFLKINPETILENSNSKIDTVDTRSILTLFHALFTYYTTFICLDSCLDSNTFSIKQRHEALGRLLFYISKCDIDLNLIISGKINNQALECKDIFTEDGLYIYREVENKFKFIKEKWGDSLRSFNLSGQPYNFTYSIFLQLNPI